MAAIAKRLFENVDAASLAIVRILFGVVMLAWCVSYLALNKIDAYYVEPAYYFKYDGFAWVGVAPAWCMTAIFASMAGFAILITVGFFYRLAAFGFAALFIYVFLVDKTTYQNHYYFVCLVSFLMAIIPAHRAYSLDAYWGRTASSVGVPYWSVWLLRFQVGVVYFFGGVAKMSPDWIRGFPMREMLAQKESHFLLGPFAEQEWVVQVIVWGGLAFDLGIVPLLLWKRTRLPAFCLVVLFHVSNSILFPIGIFPWIMIGLTTIFLQPDWPRKLLRQKIDSEAERWLASAVPWWWSRGVVAFLCVWCLVQIALPLRHWLYQGDVNWTERGHYFAWHMMLRGKISAIRFHIYEPNSGRRGVFPLRNLLQPHQLARMSRDPELIRQFSSFIEETCQSHGFADVEVRAFVLCSLNGRRPQLLISPKVDLTSPELNRRKDWIERLSEPLPDTPWDEPLSSWEQLVMVDPLKH